MGVLFMGGEIGAFTPADSFATEITGGVRYDTSFSRCAVYAYHAGSYVETPDVGAQTTLWTHFEAHVEAYGGGDTVQQFEWLDGSGVSRIRGSYNFGTATLVFEYYNGTTWGALGSVATTLTQAGTGTIDVQATVNANPGVFKVYLAGTKRIDVTPNFSSITSLNKFRVDGSLAPTAASQVVLSTDPTVGGRLFTVPITGAGATNTFSTGSYTEIDEVVYSDADFISSATANQVATFSATSPALTGYQVQAVGVAARARCGASGPQHLQLALRVSGADYFSASKTLDVGYGAFVNIWEENPATSSAWTNTAAAAVQPGVKSIA